MQFQRLTVNSDAYYELLVKPHFADLIPDGPYSGTLNEFTVMDDVSSRRRIVDILGARNILKRRDASCNIVFSPVGKANLRFIETDAIYGATMQCDNEFYQGALEDFRNSNPKFTDFIMDFFMKAIKADIDSNAYFGDIDRPNDPNGIWNWNTFDGIFKHIGDYLADGTIPSSQSSAIDEGNVTPSEAYAYLDWAFKNQDIFMKAMPPGSKAFYVSDGIFWAYHDYLKQIGGQYNIAFFQNGIPKLSFNSIEVLPEPTWSPIMTVLNGGTEANAVVLTIRGNFIFATDKSYGERTDQGVKSLMVWYSWDQLSWKYVNFMRAGTGIAFPEHMVIGMTNIS